MPKLFYALVARQKVVLCDHALINGQYESPCQSALERAIRDRVTRISYEIDPHVYHVYVSNGLTYLCVSDAVFQRSLAFGCLSELENRLTATPGLKEKASYVGPYALRRNFSTHIAEVLSEYASGDRLGHLEHQVADVTGVMRGNLEKVMERGEALDDLEDRAAQLGQHSTGFRQNAIKLRRKERCRNIKLWSIVLCVCITILVIVIVAIVIGALVGTHTIGGGGNNN